GSERSRLMAFPVGPGLALAAAFGTLRQAFIAPLTEGKGPASGNCVWLLVGAAVQGMNSSQSRATMVGNGLACPLFLRARSHSPEAVRGCRPGRLCGGVFLPAAVVAAGASSHRMAFLRRGAGDGVLGLVLSACQTAA